MRSPQPNPEMCLGMEHCAVSDMRLAAAPDDAERFAGATEDSVQRALGSAGSTAAAIRLVLWFLGTIMCLGLVGVSKR